MFCPRCACFIVYSPLRESHPSMPPWTSSLLAHDQHKKKKNNKKEQKEFDSAWQRYWMLEVLLVSVCAAVWTKTVQRERDSLQIFAEVNYWWLVRGCILYVLVWIMKLVSCPPMCLFADYELNVEGIDFCDVWCNTVHIVDLVFFVCLVGWLVNFKLNVLFH